MGTLNSACRAMLRSAVVCAGLVAASLAATSAQAADKVSIAGLTTDLGGVPLVVLGQDKELQAKHNIEVDVKLYPTVPTVWTAFTAGEFDMLPGGAAGFAAFAAKGGPVRIISTYATANADLIGKTDKITSADGLKGKKVAVPMGGLWKLTAAQIKAKYGLEPGNGYEVVPVPNLLAGVTQVLAGTADFAMGWEPDTTRVLLTYPELKIVLQSADVRPAGEPTHIQVVVGYNRMSDEAAKNFAAALGEAVKKVRADPKAAEDTFWKVSGGDAGTQKYVFANAVSAGRYNLDVHELTPEDRALIKADTSIVVPLDTVPDTFFGK